MDSGHRCSVAWTHFCLSDLHFVVEMRSQSVVSCSQSKNNNLICSAEVVIIICFVVVGVVHEPFLPKEGFNDSVKEVTCVSVYCKKKIIIDKAMWPPMIIYR